MIDQINAFLLRRLRSRQPQTPVQISLNPSGCLISGQAIKWQGVTKIVAFKRDLFGIDLICLLIATEASPLEINEQSHGWKEFLEAAQQNLPGMISFETWFPQVAFPAFELNPTILFDRGEVA